MRKILLMIVFVVTPILLAYNQLKTEAQETRYTVKGFPLILYLDTKNNTRACYDDYQARAKSTKVDDMLTLGNLNTLSKNGLSVCAVGMYKNIFNITMTAAEAVYVPTRATLPYELSKAATGVGEGSETQKCSYYVKTFMQACPTIIQSKGYVDKDFEE